MLHPLIQKGMGALLLVSGMIFAMLMMLTAVGVILIGLNGGVV